jgi:hypothetical protein
MLSVMQNVEPVLTALLSDCVWLIAGSLIVALCVTILQLKFRVLSSISLAGCNACKLTFVFSECEVQGNIQGFI